MFDCGSIISLSLFLCELYAGVCRMMDFLCGGVDYCRVDAGCGVWLGYNGSGAMRQAVSVVHGVGFCCLYRLDGLEGDLFTRKMGL